MNNEGAKGGIAFTEGKEGAKKGWRMKRGTSRERLNILNIVDPEALKPEHHP
jgi:hypothetical protein